MNSLLDKADRKIWKYAIKKLMFYIVGTMLLVYVLDFAFADKLGFSFSEVLAFDRDAIFAGQVWRIITFIFIPIDSSIFFIVLALYLSWFIGSALEAEWGAFKFNVYYLIGMLCTAIVGLITGFATNSYLHLSMFLAFAVLYPEHELRLFFVLPVKVKYLAYLDAAGMIALLIFNNWPGRIALLIAFGNFFLFFTGDMIQRFKAFKRRRKYQKEMKDYWKN